MEWRIEHFDEIDSTNTWVGAQALEGAAEGLVALAAFQSRGRGRRDRRWEAPAGSALLCSVLLRPAVDLDDVQLGVAVMALALRAALDRAAGLHADLKWPNDLLVGKATVAGLLSEVVATDEGVALVVGLGVNLTSHPLTSSTSVRDASGVTLSARELLDTVLEEAGRRRALLDSAAGRDTLRAEYEGALATLGQRVRVSVVGADHIGHARRVDSAGRLVVEVDGVERTFSAGDVVHLRPHVEETT